MEENGLIQFSMDNALEIIIVFDANGSIVYANQVAKKQLEYEDALCGSLITDIFPAEFIIESDMLLPGFDVNGNIRNMMAYRKNRTCFPVKGRFLEFCQDKDGKCTYICMVYDASEESFWEKKANQAGQEVAEALKVKSEFVANVTHELRTPVNGILGNTLELLSLENDKNKIELLRLVEKSCNDMNAIINNILDFSKLEAGKFVLEPREFNFRNMIDYVKGNHVHRIVEKGLEFSVTISPDVPEYIISDELRIVQVLNNLISNAYKFTSVGGIYVEIVKTAQSGNRVELFFVVIDSGVGIDKSQQDKLFKSFSQIDASISRKYGGTGLGLNICKQLVELMGGNIHVESDIGRGSIFSFAIWVEVPSNGLMNGQGDLGKTGEQIFLQKLQNLSENRVDESIWKYGEQENKDEVEKKMSKLILSVEMENWDKAEIFAETVKQLLEEAPKEIKSAALRLKMAVQKGDYDKTLTAFENLQKMI